MRRGAGATLGNGLTSLGANGVQQIGSATTWSQTALGEHFTCGLADDGGLRCWGTNARGARGLPDTWSPRAVEL